jgi:MFS family permease
VVVASSMMFIGSGPAHSTCINMVVGHLIEDLEITRTQVSLVWVVSLFISACGMPFAGAALDRFGSRKLLQFVTVPYVLIVFSMGLINSW